MARVAGVKPKQRKIPLKLGIGLGFLLEYRADHHTREKPAISGTALRYGAQNLFYDNRRAREELGLSFRPVEESIARALGWFRANGHLE